MFKKPIWQHTGKWYAGTRNDQISTWKERLITFWYLWFWLHIDDDETKWIKSINTIQAAVRLERKQMKFISWLYFVISVQRDHIHQLNFVCLQFKSKLLKFINSIPSHFVFVWLNYHSIIAVVSAYDLVDGSVRHFA